LALMLALAFAHAQAVPGQTFGTTFPGGISLTYLATQFCARTGCTLTGQQVFDGVSVDISTGTNQTLTVQPNGSGAVVLNATGGTEVTTPSTGAVPALLNRMQDNSAALEFGFVQRLASLNGFIAIGNASITNSIYSPGIQRMSSGSTNALVFDIAYVDATQDSGTQPVYLLDVRRGTATGDPFNVAGGAAVTTRPLLRFANFGTSFLEFSAASNLTLGGSMFELDGAATVLPACAADGDVGRFVNYSKSSGNIRVTCGCKKTGAGTYARYDLSTGTVGECT
jgi:hypothetical protein